MASKVIIKMKVISITFCLDNSIKKKNYSLTIDMFVILLHESFRCNYVPGFDFNRIRYLHLYVTKEGKYHDIKVSYYFLLLVERGNYCPIRIRGFKIEFGHNSAKDYFFFLR